MSQRAHEANVVAIRQLHRIAAVVAGTLIAIVLAMYLLWKLVLHVPTPQINSERPPAPRLQAHPTADLAVLRASEQVRLNSYAWVDREHGIARVPIERAMAMLAQQHSTISAEPVR